MDKKAYETPAIKKVKLEIKSSVLSVCRSSTVSDAGDSCRINDQCQIGAPLP